MKFAVFDSRTGKNITHERQWALTPIGMLINLADERLNRPDGIFIVKFYSNDEIPPKQLPLEDITF